MTRTVTLLGEDGAPMREGLVVELLKGDEVVTQSTTDGSGTATFVVDDEGPFRVRIALQPEKLLAAETDA
jgi:hypothetical protein